MFQSKYPENSMSNFEASTSRFENVVFLIEGLNKIQEQPYCKTRELTKLLAIVWPDHSSMNSNWNFFCKFDIPNVPITKIFQ